DADLTGVGEVIDFAAEFVDEKSGGADGDAGAGGGVAQGDGLQLAAVHRECAVNGEFVGHRNLGRDAVSAAGSVVDRDGGGQESANFETAGNVQAIGNAERAGLRIDYQRRAAGNVGGKDKLVGQGDADAARQFQLAT